MRKMIFLAALLLLSNTSASHAHDVCTPIANAESKLYGFQPTKLAKDEQTEKSVEGYEEMSRVLLHLINKLGLYSQYRTGGSK